MIQRPTVEQVDDAVRAVLGGLRRHSGGQVWERQFAAKLLSLKHAVALDATVRTLVVGPRTVITPLASEELKRRRIDVRMGTSCNRPPGEFGFAIDVESGVTASLRRELLAHTPTWVELPDGPVEWVSGTTLRGALWIVGEASVATWTANQTKHVRAATIVDVEAVARAARALGVNLLVIEAAGRSISELKQLAAAFRAAGAPTPPESILE